MGFDGELFAEVSRTQGKLRFESEGTVQEKDYSSVNFINAAGTIGYSEVTVDGKPDHIFISRTGAGIVLTMPGEQAGPAPFPIEGYKALTTVVACSPAKAFYESHILALGGEPPISDRVWLEHEVPLLGQRALDVTMKIFAQVCEQMDRMMSGLGNAMGDMIEGMGKAMGDAMEDVGKAMGEALGGAAGEGAQSAEKAALAPPEMVPAHKAPAKKARPARKVAAPRKKAKPAKEVVAPKKKVGPAKKAAAPKRKVKPARKAKKAPARKAKAPVKKPKPKGGARKRK